MPNELLGRHATDKYTGFHGLVTGYCEFLSDVTSVQISPRIRDDATTGEPRWINVERVEVDEKPITEPSPR